MPMALNLFDVNFIYNNRTGVISPGTSVMVHARKNKSPEGIIPFFISDLLKEGQDSGSNATIMTTSGGNTPSSFLIEIKLDFDLDFHCIITKNLR